MKEQEKKFSWQRLLIVLAFVIFATVVVGGSTYYVMGVQTKKAAEESDRQIKALEKQVQELAKKDEEPRAETKTEKEVVSDWQKYNNAQYGVSFEYPKGYAILKEAEEGDSFVILVGDKADANVQRGVDAAALLVYPTKNSDLLTWIKATYPDASNIIQTTVAGKSGYTFNSEGMGGTYVNYAVASSTGAYKYVFNNLVSGKLSNTDFTKIVKSLKVN